MSLPESQVYREAVAAAMAFHARKLWLEYENDDCFAVVAPGDERPMFAIIMGRAGQEYGLVLFHGQGAVRSLYTILQRDEREVEPPDSASFLSVSMTPYGEMAPPGRSFLAKAGFAGRRGDTVPFFMAKDAGRELRRMTADEARRVLYALRGIMKARDAGRLAHSRLGPDQDTLTLVLSGDPLNPEVSTEMRRYSQCSAPTPSAPPSVPEDLKALPRLGSTWLVGCPTLPTRIEGDDRTVRGVLILEARSERIVLVQAIQGGVSEAVRVICDALRGKNSQHEKGIPQQVLVGSQELHEELGPVLRALGATCRYQPGLPLLDEATRGLRDYLLGKGSCAQLGGAAEQVPPAPDDLKDWKECDRSLYARAQSRMQESSQSIGWAIEQYFGQGEAGARFLGSTDDPFPGMCFFEWYWHDFRTTKDAKTLAEQMLAGNLPRPERAILEARVRAVPSIYKVERIEKGRSLTLLDVFFGGKVVVHDKGLSETAVVDMSLPGRVLPVGRFHFLSPLGPPLAALEVEEAIEFLWRLGLQPTPEGTRAKSKLFGWLWHWQEKRREVGHKLQVLNADGDEISFHTATYAVTDQAQAQAALLARKDMDSHADGTSFTWIRPSETKWLSAYEKQTTPLGSLSFVGDELLVEVQSAKRLRRIRTLLKNIPGIEFRSVSVRTLDELREKGIPLDDRLGRAEVPMTLELEAHAREAIRRYFMDWLDRPLPALGNRTPRAACKTPEGKQRVLMLIRTMPRPMGPDGPDVDVPREEMLRELGLSESE
ncbi:MAG: DUF2384 domain-containing protein [Planctomycetes bacterium]|nr:DUF2384 domain-containing protein [Planctomycetota bacterium]